MSAASLPVRLATLAAVLAVAPACVMFKPQPPGPAPQVGALTVNVGFSSPAGAACTGAATVTITPRALTGTAGAGGQAAQPVAFGGLAGLLDGQRSGCQQAATFGSLRPGAWEVRVDGVSPGPVACQVSVGSGFAQVQVWNGVCF